MKLSNLWSDTPDCADTTALSCSNPDSCPLSRIKAGMEVRIKTLSATDEVNHHLREIGFVEKQVIKLLAGQSNFICQVCNARLALSSELAQLIIVEPVAIRVR